jgi:ribosomal protein S18 acetylase RimI-like enzyme
MSVSSDANSRTAAVVIRRLDGDGEARECATLMATSEPWVNFGRDFEKSYALVRDPSREVYVASSAGIPVSPLLGFVMLVMQGAFVGYIQSLAVHERCRGQGVGSALMEFAERRILQDQPNVFICASSFNPGAQRLYERLGYRRVGELTDFIVAGHSEILYRKTVGPLSAVSPAANL